MSHEVRVLLSAGGPRGDVGPLPGLAVRLRALGAEARVCAPPPPSLPRYAAALIADLLGWRSWRPPRPRPMSG
ncbi:hypothetical protein OG244_33540 [Streptomyces brevispora]|uniref:hypothetical protein n=1 Tax=Streptomyces brevispora TaxID=887462 RepID=UPI002E32DE45|nr:hypothetical protein [Streptomyces brevispora]